MPDNENNHVVVAIFNNEHTARDATAGLKSWDKASDDIKLGAFGTIHKLDGEIKQDLGSDKGGGLLAGGVLGVIGAVLAGPLVLLAGLVGGIVKSFFTQSVDLTEEEVQRIGKELDNGRVALVVACDDHEVAATAKQHEGAGGEVRAYEVPEQAMADAAAGFKTAR